MNKVYLLYRYDEYGEKVYLKTPEGYIFCISESCISVIVDAIRIFGGDPAFDWRLEIFYNSIQDN